MKTLNGTVACDQCGSEDGPLRAQKGDSSGCVYCPACLKSLADYDEGRRRQSLAAIQKLVGLALDEGADHAAIFGAVYDEMEDRTVMDVERTLRPRARAAVA
jgi:3'-phosphoadenosine 5'-phosphosulfate sulfotransferase (PAPS reductase)/FAD synthetase